MYHIIINPASRSGKGAKIWSEQIEPALRESDAVFQTYFSKKAGEVKHLAAQITAEYKDDPDLKLIVLGGDGTVNEALQGLHLQRHRWKHNLTEYHHLLPPAPIPHALQSNGHCCCR